MAGFELLHQALTRFLMVMTDMVTACLKAGFAQEQIGCEQVNSFHRRPFNGGITGFWAMPEPLHLSVLWRCRSVQGRSPVVVTSCLLQ